MKTNRFKDIILEVEGATILPNPQWFTTSTSTKPITKLQLAKNEYVKKCAWLDNYRSRGW